MEGERRLYSQVKAYVWEDVIESRDEEFQVEFLMLEATLRMCESASPNNAAEECFLLMLNEEVSTVGCRIPVVLGSWVGRVSRLFRRGTSEVLAGQKLGLESGRQRLGGDETNRIELFTARWQYASMYGILTIRFYGYVGSFSGWF